MRLLLVSNTYPPADISGVGTLVFEIAAEVARRGGEVRVLTRERVDDRRVQATGGRKLLFPVRAMLRMTSLGRSWKPTTVHVHESDGVLVLAWIWFCRELGMEWAKACRTVATLQVSYLREGLAVRPIVDGGRVLSVPSGSEVTFRRWRAPLLALLGRITVGLADAIVAPSAATALELRNDYGATAVVTIPNGIAVPTSLGGVERDPRRILYVGRLRTRKAVAVLLAALGSLRDRACEARLTVVGSGEQAKQLATMIEEIGLAEWVDMRGAVDREAIAGIYQESSVFCLPSTYEGFPLAILEAMAAALPVVATRVAGVPEAVVERETGILVEPCEVESLADALQALIEDPEMASRMGRAGRKRVIEEFAIADVVKRHLELYDRLAPRS